MKTPELSIIVPIYNGQDYVSRCMASILHQRNTDKYEIIAINDGSTDDTPRILNALKKTYKNIRVINQANAGVSVARNNGIRASHGEYITFVDCDDMVGLNIDSFDKYFINPSYHVNVANMIISHACDTIPNITDAHFDDMYFDNMLYTAKNTGADVVMGGKITVNRNQIYTRRHVYDYDFVYDAEPEHKHILMIQADKRENANFALYSRKMLNTNHLRFMANMKLDEDMLFCMLAVLYANRVATLKDVTYFYNRHENTLSNISDIDDKLEKQKIADIQRFSCLLHKMAKMQQYAPSFHHWIQEYSKKGTQYIYDSGEFPPIMCHRDCDRSDCNNCIIATGLREHFPKNIERYLGKTAR